MITSGPIGRRASQPLASCLRSEAVVVIAVVAADRRAEQSPSEAPTRPPTQSELASLAGRRANVLQRAASGRFPPPPLTAGRIGQKSGADQRSVCPAAGQEVAVVWRLLRRK